MLSEFWVLGMEGCVGGIVVIWGGGGVLGWLFGMLRVRCFVGDVLGVKKCGGLFKWVNVVDFLGELL